MSLKTVIVIKPLDYITLYSQKKKKKQKKFYRILFPFLTGPFRIFGTVLHSQSFVIFPILMGPFWIFSTVFPVMS